MEESKKIRSIVAGCLAAVTLVVRLDLSALATGVTGINVDKGSIIF